MDRYAGKPLLKFVDLFVLDCIGGLEASHRATLEELTPKLQQAFSSTGTWQELVMEQMGWKPGIREAIASLYVKNQSIAIRDGGAAMSPMEFVHEFVKANVKVP